MENLKSSMKKRVQDMTLAEQIEALGNEPVFRDLLNAVKEMSPDRQDALARELDTLGDRL
jgi:hypothetical protein